MIGVFLVRTVTAKQFNSIQFNGNSLIMRNKTAKLPSVICCQSTPKNASSECSTALTKRTMCKRCNKAASMCICSEIQSINNKHCLHIFQHPSEKNKAIGTARILNLSLRNVKLEIGEIFDEQQFDLQNTYLVYPNKNAASVQQLRSEQKINDATTFIILDGTWRKAHKLLMDNPFLQRLPNVIINPSNKTNYRIRRSTQKNGVSTVEAAYWLLAELEDDSGKFSPLLSAFNSMIDKQIAKMPKALQEELYGADF